MTVDISKLQTAVWVYDIDNFCIISANSAAIDLWEATSLEQLYQRDFKSNTSDAVKATLISYKQIFKNGESLSLYWQLSPSGKNKDVFVQLSGTKLPCGRIVMLCEATPATLIPNNISKNSLGMVSTFDLNGQLTGSNSTFKKHVDKGIQSLFQLIPSIGPITSLIEKVRINDVYNIDSLLSIQKNDEWFHLQFSLTSNKESIEEILVQMFNINKRKLEQISLTNEASTDPLTGLLNRREFNKQLTNEIKANNELYLFYIDLDNFKVINDSMGHATGDAVLKALSNRLTNDFFENAVVCRFGGDEFTLFIKKTHLTPSKRIITEKLLIQTNQVYIDAQGSSVQVTASVGSADYPKDGSDINELLLRADAAMYTAKSQGKKRVIQYTHGMENNLQRSSLVARYLSSAIDNAELQLFYQPIYNTKHNTIYSFEALLRWTNPVLGEISAQETIKIAEKIGAIVDIENWVINQAVSDLPELRNLTKSSAKISINISGLHVIDPYLPEYFLLILEKYQLKTSDVIIELTESSLLQDIDKTKIATKNLTNLGISLSIDDFGTGYSSLAYLHQIPTQVVKIDQSFTQRFEKHSITVNSIHQLLESLNLKTLIEGVESMAVSEKLNQIGIHLQQGYALGRPQPLSYYQSAKLY